MAAIGTTSEAAAQLGRRFFLGDDNPEALAVMRRRLAPYAPDFLAAAGRPLDE